MSDAVTDSDTITVADLEVYYRVGVPDAERSRPQRLLVTVCMRHDMTAAAADDDLERTIDYAAVSRRLRTLGEGREWRLIETLAVEIAGMMCREFGARRAGVEVKKFILPEARYVSVRAERGGE